MLTPVAIATLLFLFSNNARSGQVCMVVTNEAAERLASASGAEARLHAEADGSMRELGNTWDRQTGSTTVRFWITRTVRRSDKTRCLSDALEACGSFASSPNRLLERYQIYEEAMAILVGVDELNSESETTFGCWIGKCVHLNIQTIGRKLCDIAENAVRMLKHREAQGIRYGSNNKSESIAC